jgi:hypothetical protein
MKGGGTVAGCHRMGSTAEIRKLLLELGHPFPLRDHTGGKNLAYCCNLVMTDDRSRYGDIHGFLPLF